MDRLQQAALLTYLMKRLKDYGSWCGETHVQKSVFFLQALMDVPLGFEFILYKHGPFSFDLRNELTGLRADGLIKIQSRPPYGPQFVLTDQSNYIQELYPKTLRKYDDQVHFVAKKLGNRNVAELERLATALFLTRHETLPLEDRADLLVRKKPHIDETNARHALEVVDNLKREANHLMQPALQHS